VSVGGATLTRTPTKPEVGQSLEDRVLDQVDDRTRALIRKRRFGRLHRRGWLIRRALAVADVTGILLSFTLTQIAFSGSQVAGDRVGTNIEIALFALALPCWIVLGRLYGLYTSDEERTDHTSVDDFFGVFNMLTVGAWLFFALAYVLDFANPSFPKLALFWLLAISLVPVFRTLTRAHCRKRDEYLQNTLIVGAGHVGQVVGRKLLQHPEYGVNLVGFVDEHPRERDDKLAHLTVLGRTSDLPQLVGVLDVERVIVAFSQAPHADTLRMIRDLNQRAVQVDVVPRLFEVLGDHARIHAAEGLALIGLPPARLPRSSLFLKRAMDLILALVGLLLLVPVFVVVAMAVKLTSRGPIFFRQVRMGRGEGTFRIFKFRTMTVDAEQRKAALVHLNKHAGGDDRMFKIPDDPRVTRVGRFLRRTSLDEFPQLINVVRGEMSLVGPRPLIPDEDRYVDGWGRRRLDLKPGMTGLWQVLGRDDIPFGEMVGLDYRYVTSWSLSNDLKLLLRTVPIVLHRNGA
jgi:exopolysaccharide biosynthesis polyprenyl glycosylphosphotransferase